MSYNPNRAQQPNQARSERRQAAQTGGRSHSAIMKARGVGSFAPTGERLPTKYGHRSAIMSGKGFSSYYECIYAGNNLGFGVNLTGDKTIRIMSGGLFITTCSATKEGGAIVLGSENKTVHKAVEGSYLNLPHGTAYSIATSGTVDAEILVTESAKYDASWHEIEGGCATPAHDVAVLGQATERGRRVNSETEKAVVAERMSARQKRQASAQAESKNGPVNFNPNSSTVIGVNPMPSIIVEE